VRASRLLLELLLLQNRGRMTASELAGELGVSRRTVLRDIDALGEAGLPVLVHRGARGGFELGFNHRTRLTGLASDEAEALGVLLAAPVPELAELGLADAAARARTKLVESLPDPVRATVLRSQDRVRFVGGGAASDPDARVRALAEAIRGRRVVRLDARSRAPVVVHPARLLRSTDEWAVADARTPDTAVPQHLWGTVNVSALSY
jgi:predicted DNA-binding transcriptional regulator YafY